MTKEIAVGILVGLGFSSTTTTRLSMRSNTHAGKHSKPDRRPVQNAVCSLEPLNHQLVRG